MDYGQPVRFGVFLTPHAADVQLTLKLSALADELGFDLIGIQDHTYQWRFVDTWTLLTAIAMRTEKIQVFPDVANVPLRPPAVLAKAAATLDLLTGGRVELGLGAGGFWEAIKNVGGTVRKPRAYVSALAEGKPGNRLDLSGRSNVRVERRVYQIVGEQSETKPIHT